MARAVLFDLDGTLLDTLEDIGRAANRVLSANGYPIHSLEAYKQFVGEGAAVLFQRALPEGSRDGAPLERCISQFREDYGTAWNIATKPYPGIPGLLDSLTARGIRMSVLSNKPHTITLACVQGLLSPWDFDLVFGYREGLPKKPDPSGALAIAAHAGIPPEEFLYLGDTGTDMDTARAAGMKPIGVLWGFRSRQELLTHGAGTLLSHPGDLLDLL